MKLAAWAAIAGLGLMLAGCETGAPIAHTSPATATTAPVMHPGSPLTTRPPQGDMGTVTGTFVLEGGPIPPDGAPQRPIPLTGTLIFSAGHHRSVAVRVGKSGRFSVGLPAGNYVVTGGSPSVMEVLASGARVEEPCAQPTPVTAVAGRTVRVSVVCSVP